MYAVTFVLIIAVWALWSAYQATLDQDYNEQPKQNSEPYWPFPSSKRP